MQRSLATGTSTSLAARWVLGEQEAGPQRTVCCFPLLALYARRGSEQTEHWDCTDRTRVRGGRNELLFHAVFFELPSKGKLPRATGAHTKRKVDGVALSHKGIKPNRVNYKNLYGVRSKIAPFACFIVCLFSISVTICSTADDVTVSSFISCTAQCITSLLPSTATTEKETHFIITQQSQFLLSFQIFSEGNRQLLKILARHTLCSWKTDTS